MYIQNKTYTGHTQEEMRNVKFAISNYRNFWRSTM